LTEKIVDWPALRNKNYVFKDRLQAGALLATEIEKHVQASPVLLALPAGGIPVGYVVARHLKIPMNVAVVRKIQVPWNTEAGFGAVTWDGSVILNDRLVSQLGLTPTQIEDCISRTRKTVSERVQKFSGGRVHPEIRGREVIIVDDGLASGYTMMAAAEAIQRQKPRRTIVAVPTGSENAVQLVSTKADLLICLNIRAGFVFAVADAYEEWYDLTDEEAARYLQE
jgi:predicted phosphoribosyltransferase